MLVLLVLYANAVTIYNIVCIWSNERKETVEVDNDSFRQMRSNRKLASSKQYTSCAMCTCAVVFSSLFIVHDQKVQQNAKAQHVFIAQYTIIVIMPFCVVVHIQFALFK